MLAGSASLKATIQVIELEIKMVDSVLINRPLTPWFRLEGTVSGVYRDNGVPILELVDLTRQLTMEEMLTGLEGNVPKTPVDDPEVFMKRLHERKTAEQAGAHHFETSYDLGPAYVNLAYTDILGFAQTFDAAHLC